MVDSVIHTLGILFAIVSGTGAGVLALLSWRVFRESPFGTVVALLSVTMTGSIAYHVVLFPLASEPILIDALRSALYTTMAVFLWLVIATHHQLESAASGG